MAWEIIREHNHREPGKWSRLGRVKEVSYVLTENKGTEAIEGIMLNMPEQGLDSIMQGMPEQGISGKSFTTMKNLRLLKISNVRFSDDHFDYLSNELLFLKWRGYPLKTLPSSFQPKNLFKLDMCYSHVEFLWDDKKHLEKLKTIKLSYSCNLIETPDFTNIPNLERLELVGTKDNIVVTLLKQRLQDLSHHSYRFDICVPGTEIPEWFSHLCTVFDHNCGNGRRIECSIRSEASRTDFSFCIPTFTTAKSDHLWLGYLSREILKELPVNSCVHTQFRISDTDMFPKYSVKRGLESFVQKGNVEKAVVSSCPPIARRKIKNFFSTRSHRMKTISGVRGFNYNTTEDVLVDQIARGKILSKAREA
ncbi:hypothetical protein LWI28_006809 [Acer negundo]|uniref:Uncharacterized protein n=1 Tax=Acer negundo TaxID=4023 RepID=A0AAD5JIC4_ACENE|nr:hypothetical protein LWI28_006809 [Acer negundo]